jgi:hypothetical protein
MSIREYSNQVADRQLDFIASINEILETTPVIDAGILTRLLTLRERVLTQTSKALNGLREGA